MKLHKIHFGWARFGLAIASCVLALGTTGCKPAITNTVPRGEERSTAKAHKYPISVACTVGMVADLVREVGGEQVAVTQLMGAGVDPHLYKATRDDVLTLQASDLIFYSGLMLEGKMTDTFVKISRTKPVFAVTELIQNDTLLEPEDFGGHVDPHVWMDVSAWSSCLDSIALALSEFDPQHANLYAERCKQYKAKLDALHEYGKQSIASIPEGRRILITSHDAFNYLGRAYGIEVIGVQGISTESEAGLQQINALVDLLVQRNIQAVFIESSVSEKSIQSLIDGAASRKHRVIIGGKLFSDAMGNTGTYEGTYEGMLDHNITIITRALGGQAPERGLHGRLSLSEH
jgi:manganese/zinc/iron transport system substrate-binding protein